MYSLAYYWKRKRKEFLFKHQMLLFESSQYATYKPTKNKDSKKNLWQEYKIVGNLDENNWF